MYYRLSDDYALRAWRFVSHILYNRFATEPVRIDDDTFDLLLQCDGEHDLGESEALERLVKQGIVSSCKKGECPSDWSRYRKYEHRFVPAMNLMLTGKCNYNCLHCFNSADNADRMEEWDYDALIDLFDQAADCGIHRIILTGGEPMLHPRFDDIVRAIYERNMMIEEVMTNGFFLRQETLDMFRELHGTPLFKISFDGVGRHDWMRGREGAEEDAKRAIRLCAENGFSTQVQTQLNRGNIDVIPETLRVLEDLGVSRTRIIRTTEVARWVKRAPGSSIPWEEYFALMLDLAEQYLRGEHKMIIITWLYLILYPEKKAYRMVCDRRPDGQYHPSVPVCDGNRAMVAVTCEGSVVPCLQMSDICARLGYTFESLKERRLADILQSGKWFDAVCMNRYHLREQNKQCDECEWFGHCGGGCRLLGILDTGERTGTYDYAASDPLACLFFKGGWYDRIKERLKDYEKV